MTRFNRGPAGRRASIVVGAVVTAALLGVLGSTQAAAVVAQAGPKPIKGDTPEPVTQGKAVGRGHHDANAVLNLNVGLNVRDSAQLDALIAAASRPGNPRYGHYLTNAQYLARYAPTNADASAVRTWLSTQHLDVTGVSPDNLLVHAQGRVNQIEHAFDVKINDYTANGRDFHANDRDPSVPSDLNVEWISGLSNYDRYTVLPALTNGSLDGGDFRTAYDISGNGNGQTIGFTLWGRSLPQSDYDGYATATGTTKLTIGQAGDDGLDFVAVDGASTVNNDGEVALDTQVAHAVAPGTHETYWLGKDSTATVLEDVENTAANSTVAIISNSFGCNGCAFNSNMDNSWQHGASTGKTFLFSSGDNGASVGRSARAISPYVLAIGGTNLTLDSSSNWSSETGWSGSGGGCDNGITRPSWQTGISGTQTWGTPPTACTGRAEPDVAADSNTCAYVYVNGANSCFTGTSLSAPLWAAMGVLWNKHNAASGRPGIGFAPPLIYSVANDSTTYAFDFHDITSGSNGFSAGSGWDEVTGWGSPDYSNLIDNPVTVTYTGPLSANHGDTITLSGSLHDQGFPTALSGRTLTFAAAGESCTGVTDGSGNASCSVTVNDSPGHYSVIAVFAGDGAWLAGSVTKTFTVNHIPTTVSYTGPTSGDYNDAVALAARLTENSDGAPVSGETLNFSFGGESCAGVTDVLGFAHCNVTPLDSPAGSPYAITASFAGDSPTYEASSDASKSFTVNREDTAVAYTGPLTQDYHDPVTLAAKLTDAADSTPIVGKTISFAFGLESCSASTDGSGNASCSVTPQDAAGTYALSASFAGDTYYANSGDTSKSFVVTPEETTTTYTGPLVILGGGHSVSLSGRLLEDGNSAIPISGRTLTLSVGTDHCSGTTNAAGNATCTLTVSTALGSNAVKAEFAGDAYYRSSSDASSAIVFAFPSSGVFTLGDSTVASATPTTTVTWWSDTWAALNSLSGGGASPAFKGFAGAVTLPTATPPASCGSSWTTTGGNSPPPATSVPSYMGVLVTSSVAKAGSTISGNPVKIVVVKINAGYAPTPMNAGTGTIVATFC